MKYNIKPFLKWAGGKRQIIDKIKENIPREFNKYYEPFVGGGAVFFAIETKKIVINDYNSELINIYNILKDIAKTNKLIKILDSYEKDNSEEFYYKIRGLDREKDIYEKLSDVQRAARTIYLNKTCFNGLYRVNSKNEFNVPFNQKQNVKTYEYSNLININKYFNEISIELLCGDFEKVTKDAKKEDFIYFDPPYDSIKTSFISYTDKGFSREDQIRLFEEYKRLDKIGAYVMLSNHNTPFINSLYKDYNIKVINARRNINSNGKGRGKVEETIITNY